MDTNKLLKATDGRSAADKHSTHFEFDCEPIRLQGTSVPLEDTRLLAHTLFYFINLSFVHFCSILASLLSLSSSMDVQVKGEEEGYNRSRGYLLGVCDGHLQHQVLWDLKELWVVSVGL